MNEKTNKPKVDSNNSNNTKVDLNTIKLLKNDGRYDEEMLNQLSIKDLILLLIYETSHQDAMNIIRKTFNEI